MQPFHSEEAVEGPVLQYLQHLLNTKHLFLSTASFKQVTLLGQGYNNRLYDFQSDTGSWVLKIYPRGRDMRMQKEYMALQLLDQVEGIPKAIWAESNARFLNVPVMIYQKMPGQPIQNMGVKDEDLDRLNHIWQSVQQVKPPHNTWLSTSAGPCHPRECLDYILATMHTLSQSAADHEPSFNKAVDQLREFIRCLNILDLKEGLWHQDHIKFCQVDNRLGNIIKDEKGAVYIIDWEHAGMLDPAYELASFFWHPEAAEITTAQRDRCIQAYCEDSSDIYAYEKIMVYLTILPVQWVARLLTLIEADENQSIQPWVTPRTSEELWEDLKRYLHITNSILGDALLH